jgi:hypothetical protein
MLLIMLYSFFIALLAVSFWPLTEYLLKSSRICRFQNKIEASRQEIITRAGCKNFICLCFWGFQSKIDVCNKMFTYVKYEIIRI